MPLSVAEANFAFQHASFFSMIGPCHYQQPAEEENMIQVDVIISPPSLGAPPNYFSSEAVTVASQLHLGRPASAKRAVCMVPIC